MKTREDILEQLKSILEELFEVDPNDVTVDARLYEDLDLDSIDAIDMIVKLQELVGRKQMKKVSRKEFQSRGIKDLGK